MIRVEHALAVHALEEDVGEVGVLVVVREKGSCIIRLCIVEFGLGIGGGGVLVVQVVQVEVGKFEQAIVVHEVWIEELE